MLLASISRKVSISCASALTMVETHKANVIEPTSARVIRRYPKVSNRFLKVFLMPLLLDTHIPININDR